MEQFKVMSRIHIISYIEKTDNIFPVSSINPVLLDRINFFYLNLSKIMSKSWRVTFKETSQLFRMILFGCFLIQIASPSFAGERPVAVIMLKGEAYLLDKDKKKEPAIIGQEFLQSEYPWVQNNKSSTLYIQTGNKLVEIEQEGVFLLKELFQQKSSILKSSLGFLNKLANPRSYISQLRVRGDSESAEINDQAAFEDLWQQLVLEPAAEKSQFTSQELLAMAAWFQKQGKSARVAYLLERLNTSSSDKNEYYGKMRMDALQNVTLSDINREVKETREAAKKHYQLGRHKALLIGINDYDEPSWQTLKTPVKDVEQLKNLLISDYFFEETDVVILKNASFDRIIGAFNDIKKVTDSNTNLLIYYAGHGYYPPGEEEGYWVPKDAGSPETQRLFIPTSTILSKIKSIQSRHTLVIADSCFSGSLIRTTRGAAVHSRYFRDLSTKKSRQIITSGGLEPVVDQGWGDNSVFAGKLIDILKEKRNTPLSASELALNLRKEVKNANAIQTPEYGRLHMSDDQSGEFFFVRKDQNPMAVIAQSEPLVPARDFTDQNLNEVEEEEVIFPSKDGYRLNFGLGFQVAILNYRFSYQDSNGEKKTESDSTALTGTIMHLGVKRTIERFNYELLTSFGQISTSAIECDREDENTEFCSKYAGSSVSGKYTAAGVYASYSVLPKFYIDVEVGGGLLYQNYEFKKLLDARDLDSTFISGCVKAELSYLIDNWFIGESNEFCAKAYQVSGNLSDYENNSLSDLQIPFNIKISLMAGYRF